MQYYSKPFLHWLVFVVVVVIFLNDDPVHTLVRHYGRHVVFVPVGALPMILTWAKVWKIIRYVKAAIAEHRTNLIQNPSAIFTGMLLGKWKTRLVIFASVGMIIGKLAFVIIMSDHLKMAVRRLPNSNMKTVDTVCVVLFSLIVAGAVGCFVSVCHAAYTILLFARRLPVPTRWYPLLIYDHAGDVKPVLLL